jgi:type I restriction enzyme M protein
MKHDEQQLGIEALLWDTANSLRGSVASSDYKSVILGILFMKYMFDSKPLGGKHGFPSTKGIEWKHVIEASKSPRPQPALDKIIGTIEAQNSHLKQTFPRFSQFEGLKSDVLQRLIEVISPINLTGARQDGKDILSRTYEYFLTKFAAAEGRLGGEFYTPRSIVGLMTELLQPFSGTIYDPACGTGGLFIQAKASSEKSGRSFSGIRVVGQESNPMTWRLARLNLALHQVDFDLGATWADTFSNDLHENVRADFILTNPPFGKGTEWPRDTLCLDPRWEFGLPPAKPSNYVWLQHYVARLSENGVAVAVMPNGTLTSRGAEGQIRRALVEADLVECIISLPNQLFYSTPIPVCLWILNKNKSRKASRRDRKNEILLIDGRSLGHMTSKVHRDLSELDIRSIVDVYHSWQGRTPKRDEIDPHFAAVVSSSDLSTHDYSLNPSEYVSTDQSIDVNRTIRNSDAQLVKIISLIGQSNKVQSRLIKNHSNGNMGLVQARSTKKKWREVQLKEVCRIIGGGTPSTKVKDYFGSEVPWITPRDMATTDRREIFRGERFLSHAGLQSSGAKMIPKGSVLVSSRAPIGLVAIAGQDLATNQGIRSLILNDDQDSRFWYYLMKTSYKRLDAAGNGTTFRELRGSTMQELTFSIPDFEIQQEIASYLDDLQVASDLSSEITSSISDFVNLVAPMLVASLAVPTD